MKTSMKKRALALALAVLMVIGLVPTGFLAREAKAEGDTTYTATPGAINSYFTLTDGATEDTAGGQKFYKLDDGSAAVKSAGRLKLNTSSSKASSVSNNSIAFTVSSGTTATVKVWAISSNSTNVGKIGLYKEDGTEVTVTDAYPTQSVDKGYVTGDSSTEYGKEANPILITFEVSDLAAGKYYIGSPAGQGANVYYVSVTEKAAPVVVTNDYTATPGAINSYFTLTDGATEDTAGGQKFYKLDDGSAAVKSAGRLKLNTSSSKASSVSNNSIAFTVSSGTTATVKVWAISSNSTNVGKIGLYKEDGTEVTVTDAYPTQSVDKGYVTGDSSTEYGKEANPILITFEVSDLAAGKYYIGSPAGQGANVYYVGVTEATSGGSVVTPVNAPTATEIKAVQDETDLTKVNITVKGTPATENSDGSKYVVVRIDTEKTGDTGTVVESLDGTKTEVTCTDTLTSSGKYQYQVYGKGDSNTAAVTATPDIKYIAKPSVKVEQVSGKLALKATWKADDYATKYVVTVKSSDGTVVETAELEKTATEFTTTATLKDGYKYTVVVEMVCANADDNVKSDAVSVRPYIAIDMANAIPGMNIANGYKDTSKVGKLFVLRDKGNMSVSQTSNTASKIASGGSEVTTYVYADKTSKDFTISAKISVTGVERTTTGNQQGIFVGATAEIPGEPKSGVEAITKIVSAELGTNNTVYAAYYEALEAGKFGRSADTAAYSQNSYYDVSVVRSGAKYTLSVSDKDGKVIFTKEVEVADEALKGEVYPAILLAGVDADIKELKVVVDGNTVVDSTTYTDSFVPYIDNWEDADAPVIVDNTANKSNPDLNKIYIKVNCDFTATGASKVTVFMKDANGKTVGKAEVAKDGGEASFSPSSSGKYYFIAMASRTGEEKNIFAEEVVVVDFTYKMPTPGFVSITNDGNYSVRYKWTKVNEAEKYLVSYKAGDGAYSTPVAVTDTQYTATGLSAGTYTFKVCAVKGENVGEGLEKTIVVSEKAETEWMYSAFGGSNATVDNGKNSASGNPNAATAENPVKVNSGIPSENVIGGKLVTGASADEISYYYTELKSNMNFTLKARVHVNSLKEDGGQVGFGLIATDSVDESSKGSAYYTNSVATCAGKVEYYYDPEIGAITSDASKLKYSIYNGLAARYKVGSIDTATPGNGSVILPLTTDPSDKGLDSTTKWNVIGAGSLTNATGTPVPDTLYNDFYLELKKDNTGFLCTFFDSTGKEIKKQRIYDLDNEYLTTIEKDTYNVGFFAARCVDVQFTDITFTTIAAADDAPAEDVEYTLITPTATVTTTSATGCPDYEMQFVANADGVVTITAPDGKVLVDNKSIKANEVVKAPSYTLTYGKKNEFKITFTPDKDYVPGKYQKLSSYETIEQTFNVSYIKYGTSGQSIWVSPDGSSKGTGTKKNPLDIYTAVKFVQPGQQIILMEGTYKLESTVKVARGVNGTEDKMIYLIADPDAKSRPVFDFQKMCAGFVFAGDYWYIQGFDVTHSGDKMKAVQVSGNYNTLDQINAYYNGDTGIQISRLLASDTNQSMWPSYNTILNCTSYNNADPTYADADGFAAKITVGKGNVFDGCISHHNADDGWDLFAYPDTGAIGSVVIKNSVAYMNGYVIKDNDGNLDMDGGNLIDAGNGNGFKMGGNSITGYHKLVNSIAFENKAKGIDCNSCPDIQVEKCTSVNNGSYNLAMYSGSAKNTDFSADGVLCFRTNKATSIIDTDGDYVDTTGNKGIKMVGNQDVSKVINETTYLWMPSYVPEVADKFDSYQASLAAGGVLGYGSYNSVGDKVSESWFVSLDTANPNIVRNSDGSIDMNGLLVLTEEADTETGARMVNTLSRQFVGYAPVTGDRNNVIIPILIVAMLLSLVAIAGVVIVNKKKKVTK
ncbi:MAG: hypothetical protein ACI4E1_05475 [Lachnospira sp.]